ncbi:MAG: beta-L-arabinofuranosidase domain-containing protein [Anaerolineae bacterium]
MFPRSSPGHPAASRKLDLLHPSRISLGSGLLRQRFQRNRDRLYDLSTDSLLKRYRERAGQPAPGAYLSTWDEGRGICGGGGEFLGHWLSAAAHICAVGEDADLRAKLDEVIAGLEVCADADGYVSTAAEGDFERYTHNFYRLDKLIGGLLDAYYLTERSSLLHMATGSANRFWTYLEGLTIEQVEERLTTVWKDEAYGALENMNRLYELTGDARYLAFASKLEIRPLRDRLAAGDDALYDLHSYSHDLLFLGYGRTYENTAQGAYLDAMRNAWDMIAARTYVTGGNGDGYPPMRQEAWRNVGEMPLAPLTQETCGSYAWMKHSAYLLMHTAEVRYADMLERTLYNHLLPSQGPGRGDWAYWLPMHDHAQMIFGYCWNDPNFTLDGELCGMYYCCDGTGTRAMAEFPTWAALQDERGLFVSLYTSGRLRWEQDDQSLTFEVETSYPWKPEIVLTASAAPPTPMALRLRIPGWVREPVLLQVNGEDADVPTEPGTWATLTRTWQDGDQVRLVLPMTLHQEQLQGDEARVALLYGPLVLAAMVGFLTEPVWPDRPEQAAEWLTPSMAEPLAFLAPNRHMHWRPLFTVTCEPYSVYLQLPPTC